MTALDRDGFEALYRRHAGELLGFLMRRGVGPDAEDLLAETFLLTWRRRDELPDADRHRAWLFGVARRLLLARSRAGTRPTSLDALLNRNAGAADAAVGLLGSGSGLPEAGISAERTASVRAALADLPELDRELLTLTLWDGLTVAEAAEVLGLDAGNGRVRLHRARRRLARDPRIAGLLSPSTV